MIAVLSFLLLVILVVSVHEGGHYIAARFFGVWVVRFSVGFGKPLWSRWDDNGTQWVIAPIPLGGYVQLLDDDTVAKLSPKGQAGAKGKTVESKNNWQRFVIYAAGPLANLVFAAVILTPIYYFQGQSGLKAQIGAVRAESAAARAGVQAGGPIIAVNGQDTLLWRQAALAVADAALSGGEVGIDGGGGRRWTIPAGNISPSALEAGGDVMAAIGLFPRDDFLQPTVSRVEENSAAARAGIQEGDKIAALDDAVIDHWRDLVHFVRPRAGQTVQAIVWRDGAALTLRVVLGETRRHGKPAGLLGVSPTFVREKFDDLSATIRHGFFDSMRLAVANTIAACGRTVTFLSHIVGGRLSFDNLSGPVGIAEHAGAAAQSGVIDWWRFAALLSVSLAVMNLLPLPVLDGGQMMICVIQSVIRRPLPKSFLLLLQRAGVMVLLLLITGVIINDIFKLMGG